MAHSDSPRTNWLSAERLLLAGLLVFTLAVRGGVLWAMRENLSQDPDLYREIAENLLRHGEFAVGNGEPGDDAAPIRPTAFRPPLYPVVLSNLPAAGGNKISLTKVAALHLLLGVATVWLTWLTAKRLCRVHECNEMHHDQTPMPLPVHCAPLTQPTLGPLLAGFLVACDPILLNQQALVMTETLAAFLAILGLWCLARFDCNRSWFNAALAGGAIGLAVLCRPTFLPWLGLVGLGILAVCGGPNFKSQISNLNFHQVGWRLLNAAALGIIGAAVISPWVIRNYRVFGTPIATTTHGGYTLYLGNNEEFYRWLRADRSGLPWDSERFDFEVKVESKIVMLTEATLTTIDENLLLAGHERQEVLQDEWAYLGAKEAIRHDRATFAIAALYRVHQLWSPLPNKLTAGESAGRRLLRYATAAWYCGVYTLAAIGIWRLRWKVLQPPWIWGVLLCLAFTAVHTFYWTNLRMRAPLMPFVAIVAGAAVVKSKVQAPISKVEGSRTS